MRISRLSAGIIDLAMVSLVVSSISLLCNYLLYVNLQKDLFWLFAYLYLPVFIIYKSILEWKLGYTVGKLLGRSPLAWLAAGLILLSFVDSSFSVVAIVLIYFILTYQVIVTIVKPKSATINILLVTSLDKIKISFKQSIIRNIIFLIPFISIVEAVLIIIKKPRIGDMLAKTRVIQGKIVY